jgi:short-subunit dehydrogenase
MMNEQESIPRVVVTGGTEGIGRSITEQLLSQGAIVATCARNESRLNELLQKHPSLITQVVDISDRHKAGEFVKSTIEKMGGIDLLILNAATHGVPDKNEKPEEAIIRKINIFQVNEVAQLALTRTAKYALKESHGTVVFLTSGLASVDKLPPGSEDYAKSKKRIESYLQDFIKRPENVGIFVFCVNPGPVDTKMHNFIINRGPEQLAEMSKAGKEKGMMSDPIIVGRVIAKMATTRMNFNPEALSYNIPIENGSIVTVSRESLTFEKNKLS